MLSLSKFCAFYLGFNFVVTDFILSKASLFFLSVRNFITIQDGFVAKNDLSLSPCDGLLQLQQVGKRKNCTCPYCFSLTLDLK